MLVIVRPARETVVTTVVTPSPPKLAKTRMDSSCLTNKYKKQHTRHKVPYIRYNIQETRYSTEVT